MAKDYQQITRRYLQHSKGFISKKAVRQYLSTYLQKAPKTYNNQLCALRAFIARFYKRLDIIQDFKKAPQPFYERKLPTRNQVRKGFYSLDDEITSLFAWVKGSKFFQLLFDFSWLFPFSLLYSNR